MAVRLVCSLLIATLVVLSAAFRAHVTARTELASAPSESLPAQAQEERIHLQLVQDNWCNVGDEAKIHPDESIKKACDNPGKPEARLKELRGFKGKFPYLELSNLLHGLKKSGGVWVYTGTQTTWPAFGGTKGPMKLASLTCDQKTGRRKTYLWRQGSLTSGVVEPLQIINDLLQDQEHGRLNCKVPISLRAAVDLPPWMAIGWSPSSPGFVLSYKPTRQYGKQIIYGTDLLESLPLGEAEWKATRATLYGHQYAAASFLEWHSLVLVEWRQGQEATTSTVFELAFLNGLGGYKGTSNFYDDWTRSSEAESPQGKKHTDESDLLQAMRFEPAMLRPWDSSKSEIRALDIAGGKEAFWEYLKTYSGAGPDKRFSHLVEVATVEVHGDHRRKDIFRALLSYIKADGSYRGGSSDFFSFRNCQTFSVDFFQYLTGQNLYYHMVREHMVGAHDPDWHGLKGFDDDLKDWLGPTPQQWLSWAPAP